MEKNAKVLEFRTNSGEVLFSIYMYDKAVPPTNKLPKGTRAPFAKNAPKQGKDHNTAQTKGNGGDLMSDAQKRYLFRILAEDGIEGDNAYEYLKEVFQVNSLQEVTKASASQMIDYLLNGDKEGGAHDQPPF